MLLCTWWVIYLIFLLSLLHLDVFIFLFISHSYLSVICAVYLVHMNVNLAMVLLEQRKEDLG